VHAGSRCPVRNQCRAIAEYPEIAQAPTPLCDIAAALSDHHGPTYDRLWVNLYRDHRDSTSWHGDGPLCKRDECIVAVLSLGAARRFLIRPVDGGRSIRLTPSAGDLIVTGGRAQKDWRHMVPKQTQLSDPRISVNFKSSEQARNDD
jgi:alkylated DNA repair dioxygenase AlkB